jgi:hypothetical protein
MSAVATVLTYRLVVAREPYGTRLLGLGPQGLPFEVKRAATR